MSATIYRQLMPGKHERPYRGGLSPLSPPVSCNCLLPSKSCAVPALAVAFLLRKFGVRVLRNKVFNLFGHPGAPARKLSTSTQIIRELSGIKSIFHLVSTWSIKKIYHLGHSVACLVGVFLRGSKRRCRPSSQTRQVPRSCARVSDTETRAVFSN